ncbi:hypothetical protein EDB84DRAFT_1445962 [Lactarius hengduanensis]|nr:hypothetical protein EDB84DRAFT_1445962 [Lactarius hengduanensis]
MHPIFVARDNGANIGSAQNPKSLHRAAHAFVTRVANVDHRHARHPVRCVSVGSSEMEEQSRRDYIRELREVADEADVVLMLDVHDLTGAAPTGRGGNAQLRDGGNAARVRVHKNDVQATDPEVAEAGAEDARGP